MKKSGILNAELMRVITSMGHTDRLVIADSGLPIPPSVLRIDLALSSGVPTFAQTLQAVLNELQVESATVAEEMRQRSPALYQATRHLLGATPLQHISHEQFKGALLQVRAVVRTGEQTPYANIILQSGVTF
ncbi:MAG: D-ribose pyranase [Bacillati bacterium ANGP1]|uniref:D-ribose pyranase n=1 Tax=Candidatus Segetimicrobium genomatis TaxID=2569760 RepID=A0A537LE80_9BACT|nr:MAG: D-ribose pyranase [Terrabacteria group bacterium ANGP1]